MKTGVYRIKCVANDYFYVGSAVDCAKRVREHLRSLKNGTHHNVFLQRVFNKYGSGAFNIRVKETKDQISARRLEQHYLDRYCGQKCCMNIGRKSSGGDNLTNNPNRKQIIKNITKGVRRSMRAMSSEERIEKFGNSGSANGMYGKTHTAKVRKILSKLHTGNSHAKGHKWSEESRERLASAIAKKQAAGTYVNAFQGRKHSETTLAKMRAAQSRADRVLPLNTLRIKVGKKTYLSASKAAEALGCVAATILNRARSEKFPDYRILD